MHHRIKSSTRQSEVKPNMTGWSGAADARMTPSAGGFATLGAGRSPHARTETDGIPRVFRLSERKLEISWRGCLTRERTTVCFPSPVWMWLCGRATPVFYRLFDK